MSPIPWDRGASERREEREDIAADVEALGCNGGHKHGGPLCGTEGYVDPLCPEHAIADMIRAGGKKP